MVAFLLLMRDDLGKAVKRIGMLALAALCLLGSLGDPLFIPMFTAAITAAGLTVFCCGIVKWNRFTIQLIIAWVFSIAGALLAKEILNIASTKTFAKPSLERVWLALKQLSLFFREALAHWDMIHWLGVSWIVAGFLAVLIVRRRRRTQEDENRREPELAFAVMLVFFAFSALGMLAAPVAGGDRRRCPADRPKWK
jgi:hypothetical protein